MRTRLQSLGIALALVCFMVTSALATNPTETNPDLKKELRSEIMSLVQDDISATNLEGTAKVSFIINSKKELVVLNVDTQSNAFENHIKWQLNYQELKTKGLSQNKPYHVKITFKQS